MIDIHNKVYNLLDNSDDDFINKLIKQIPIEDLDFLPLKHKSEILNFFILNHYADYKASCLEFEEELRLVNDVNQLLNTYGVSKTVLSFQIYNNTKFCKSECVSKCLNILGIRDVYQSHFVDIEEVEIILFEILSNGILINFSSLLLIVDLALEIRIIKEYRENFIAENIRNKYEGVKNVSELDIQLRNLKRKIKYSSTNAKKLNDFELLIKELYEKQIENMDIFKALRDTINSNTNYELRRIIHEALTPAKCLLGRPIFINQFKHFFHLLFENRKEGLLDNDGFENENEINQDFAGTYNGNYKKYYSTRIKTLTGL